MQQLHDKKRRTATPEPRPVGITVGATVQTSCTKCKSVTSHVVVGKVGAVPTRVECTACSTVHAYRATRRRDARPAVDDRAPEVIWQDAMRRARRPAVPYSACGHYEVGARLTHASFGEGVVSRLTSTTVCEVLFSTGAIKLLMGAPEAPSRGM